MKFIIMVWLAFLARHRPVSTIAKPACMNITRKPVIRVHTKLIATLFWPAWLTRSPMVRPFLLSLTTTSDTVPVSDPSGSPLARASAEGGGTFLMSWSAIITGGGAGAAAGAAPGAAGAAAAGAGAAGAGAGV